MLKNVEHVVYVKSYDESNNKLHVEENMTLKISIGLLVSGSTATTGFT